MSTEQVLTVLNQVTVDVCGLCSRANFARRILVLISHVSAPRPGRRAARRRGAHLPPHKCSESHTSLALARVATTELHWAADSPNEALTKQKAPITTFAVLRFAGRYSSGPSTGVTTHLRSD